MVAMVTVATTALGHGGVNGKNLIVNALQLVVAAGNLESQWTSDGDLSGSFTWSARIDGPEETVPLPAITRRALPSLPEWRIHLAPLLAGSVSGGSPPLRAPSAAGLRVRAAGSEQSTHSRDGSHSLGRASAEGRRSGAAQLAPALGSGVPADTWQWTARVFGRWLMTW
jgi:hypothetical protein